MDDNKNDDLSKMIPEFNQFDSGLKSASNQDNILLNAQKTAAINAKKAARAQEAMAAAINSSVGSMLGFAKGLQRDGSGNNFGAVNKVVDLTVKVAGGLASMIPVVGGALEGLAEGAGEVAKFMIGQFAKAYGNFEKLSDTGVVSTFEELKTSSASTGLNFEDTAKVFSKYSKQLSAFGGAAELGRKRVDMIMFESKEASKKFQRIGMSAEDFADSQLQYISQLQLSGGAQGKTDKQLKDGSIKYIEMIDTLSKTTGVTRKELKDQIDERQRNARYLAGVASLDEKQQTEITKVLSQFGAADPEMEEGLRDLIASDGRITTEKAKATYLTLSRGGMDVAGQIHKLRTTGNAQGFMKESTRAAVAAKDELTDLTKYVGADTLATRNYVGVSNLALKKDMDFEEVQKQINAAREKSLNENGGQNSDLAAARRSLYNSGQMLDQLATSSGLVTSVLSTMAEGLDDVTSTIYAALGEKLPPYLQLRKEETASVKKTAQIQKDRALKEEELATLKTKRHEEESDPNSQRGRSIRRKQQQAEDNMESELKILELQIKDQELETQMIKKKRVAAENTPGGGTQGNGTQGGSNPPSGQPSTGTQGGSNPPSGQTSTGTQGSNGAPTQPVASGSPSPGGPGLGARESERNEVNQPGYGEGGGKKGIGVIRDMIAEVESIGGSYNSLFGGGTKTPLTSMTINEVLKHQDEMLKRGSKSTAAGRYQFMSYTLPEYAKKAKLDFGTTKFDEKTQDMLADILIREKGYDRYKNGQITDKQFLSNLSRAWAGLPNPEKAGKSNYAGDGLNKSNTSVEKSLAKIGQARTGGIFSGPSTGYLAELHGDEAVIPANDGMARQQFLDLMGGGSNEDMAKIFEMMTKKISSMITIANEGVGIQKKAKNSNVTLA